MVIQRSRKWVKDRLPAFICRETSWWVARWIQCNVFLCPECRKEYRSLKSVWERLDQWEVEDPEGEVEACFIENFRQKYPAAYSEEEASSNASGFWIPRVAYLCAVALLGFAVLWQPQVQRTAVRTVKVETSTAPTASAPQPLSNEVQIAEAPAPQPETQEVVALVPQGWNRGSSVSNFPAPGTRFRTTSTADPLPSLDRLDSPARERTVEINDMPVSSAFDSLSQPYREDRPY